MPITATIRDLAHQVLRSIEASPGARTIDAQAIAEELWRRGVADIDDVDHDTYWRLIQQHDCSQHDEPTITPCPVQWCDQTGSHVLDYSRICRHVTGVVAGAEIGAEVYSNEDGELAAPVVEIGGPGAGSFELTSAEDVRDYVLAVLRASAVAFPTGSADLHPTASAPLGATQDAVRSTRTAGTDSTRTAGTDSTRTAGTDS